MKNSLCVWACLCVACGARSAPALLPEYCDGAERKARQMAQAARTVLRPVYAPLAERCVASLDLAQKAGIGLDVGGGPGTLTVELAVRTPRMYWIDVDINPYSFTDFFEFARSRGVGHRVGAVFADVAALPFRDGYADIVVSRGSFHFWDDKPRAFAEIHRVLKPGGVAVIGRGFSENLPVDVARSIRAAQKERGGPPRYDLEAAKAELERLVRALGVASYSIRTPKPEGSDGVSYGVWLEFRK